MIIWSSATAGKPSNYNKNYKVDALILLSFSRRCVFRIIMIIWNYWRKETKKLIAGLSNVGGKYAGVHAGEMSGSH